MTISVCLSLPPSTNRLWRYVKGRAIKSEEYRKWLAYAAQVVSLATRAGVIDGPYALRVEAGMVGAARRDLDNLLKPLGDCLMAGGAVRDDRHCRRIEAEWRDGVAGVVVTIEPYPMAAARSGCAEPEGVRASSGSRRTPRGAGALVT